jgi:hypothetical protein
MDRFSKILFIPAVIGTLAGVGLDMTTNMLASYWPDAPHWLVATLFWAGPTLIVVPLPSWLLWLAWTKRNTMSGRWRMIVGLILVVFGCGIGIVGMAIIASGTSTAALLAKITPSEFTPFKLDNQIYRESRRVQKSDGQETNLFENRFYLVVGNQSPSGKTLRQVQARVHGYEVPVLLASIQGTTVSQADIQHGEWAYFQIGRIVSSERYGPFKGNTIIDSLAEYEHNVPIGAISFEVWSLEPKKQFTLNQWPNKSFTWNVPVTISASDTKSIDVVLDVNLNDKKSSVSIHEGVE